MADRPEVRFPDLTLLAEIQRALQVQARLLGLLTSRLPEELTQDEALRVTMEPQEDQGRRLLESIDRKLGTLIELVSGLR